jgi:hypothetical protein
VSCRVVLCECCVLCRVVSCRVVSCRVVSCQCCVLCRVVPVLRAVVCCAHRRRTYDVSAVVVRQYGQNVCSVATAVGAGSAAAAVRVDSDLTSQRDVYGCALVSGVTPLADVRMRLASRWVCG